MLRLTTLLLMFPLHIQALELETPAGLKKNCTGRERIGHTSVTPRCMGWIRSSQ
jgi:hypothetical protein